MSKLILGSSSQFRKKVLEGAGYEFETASPDINEKVIRYDKPGDLTVAIARAKAQVLIPKLEGDCVLITSDQVAVVNGEIREKPESKDQLRFWLENFSEHYFATYSGVYVYKSTNQKEAWGLDVAYIKFKPLTEEVIEEILTEESMMTSCGGFQIDYLPTDPFIERVIGDRDSIMGMPLKLMEKLLLKVGCRLEKVEED